MFPIWGDNVQKLIQVSSDLRGIQTNTNERSRILIFKPILICETQGAPTPS
jgi:hypothetical protein